MARQLQLTSLSGGSGLHDLQQTMRAMLQPKPPPLSCTSAGSDSGLQPALCRQPGVQGSGDCDAPPAELWGRPAVHAEVAGVGHHHHRLQLQGQGAATCACRLLALSG